MTTTQPPKIGRFRGRQDEDHPSKLEDVGNQLGEGVLEKLDDLTEHPEARGLGRRAALGLTADQLLAELGVNAGVSAAVHDPPEDGDRHGGDAENGQLVEALP